MKLRFTPASFCEIETCLQMMERYYEADHLRFERGKALAAVTALITSPIFGRIWLFSADLPSSEPTEFIGYLGVTYGYSLEAGGRNAFVDELYVMPEFRGRGAGTAAIAHALDECRSEGIQAVRLEVTKSNSGAKELYQRIGFRDLERNLLAFWMVPSASSEVPPAPDL